MKNVKTTTLALLFIISILTAEAQTNIKKYDIKKGQVFDIIFLTKKPGTDAALQDYFKRVFPLAEKYGYHTLPGFTIKDNPTQGNYHPQNMILGYWTSLKGRVEGMKKIEKEVPDFHEMRRDIWSNFDMTYYDLKEDLPFELDKDKLNVVNTYWYESVESFRSFNNEWLKQVKKAGGKVSLELKNGESPFGYYHKPDYVVITSWDSQAAFDKFYAQNIKMDHSTVKHVNQFIIK